jgi:hypothetical protein
MTTQTQIDNSSVYTVVKHHKGKVKIPMVGKHDIQYINAEKKDLLKYLKYYDSQMIAYLGDDNILYLDIH